MHQIKNRKSKNVRAQRRLANKIVYKMNGHNEKIKKKNPFNIKANCKSLLKMDECIHNHSTRVYTETSLHHS